MGKGLLSKPPEKRKKSNADRKMAGLNRQQSNLVRARENRDLSIGNAADNLFQGVQDSLNQPFDWNALPQAPVQGDYDKWRQDQINSTYNDFTSRMNPQFKQQMDEFEQTMYNSGIPMGSDLYNREKSRLEQSQNDARSNALIQAQGIAGQNAGQFFDIGTTARGNAYNEAMAKRNMPLSDYQNLLGLQSGYSDAALAQNFATQNQQKEFDQQRWMLKNTPHGGGGGGGGAGPVWAQYGYSTPQEYDAYKTAQARENAAWEWANNPQYRKPSQPNPYTQLGGGILGAFAGGLGQSLGRGIFS